jgi:hypothetical protein
MAKATEDPTNHRMQKLTAGEVQSLADRLFSRGISRLSTDQPEARADLVAASQAIRALLIAFEHGTGRQLSTILVCGEGS